ncbi:MAG: hypothetical protein ACRDRQ_24075 [Pseudonocardiaceae bacterium]
MQFLDMTVQLLTCVNLLLTTPATGLLLRRYHERKDSGEKK